MSSRWKRIAFPKGIKKPDWCWFPITWAGFIYLAVLTFLFFFLWSLGAFK